MKHKVRVFKHGDYWWFWCNDCYGGEFWSTWRQAFNHGLLHTLSHSLLSPSSSTASGGAVVYDAVGQL